MVKETVSRCQILDICFGNYLDLSSIPLSNRKGSNPFVRIFARVCSSPVLDSPDQGLPLVLFLESLYTKLNVLDQLPFSQTLLVSLETPSIQNTLYQLTHCLFNLFSSIHHSCKVSSLIDNFNITFITDKEFYVDSDL